VRMFQRAVELDSSFVLAWASLSEALSRQYWFFFDRTDSALAKAKAAADRALRLRPDMAEPHVALGYYYYWGSLDYDRALRELAVARERQPNNANLIFAVAAIQRRQGRLSESVANFERAVQLEPRSSYALYNLGETYQLVRKYDQAIEAFDKAININPDGELSYVGKIWASLATGARVDQIKPLLLEGIERAGFTEMARTLAGGWSVASDPVSPSFLMTADPAHQSALERLAVQDFTDSVAYYNLKADMYRARKRPALETAYLDSAGAVLESQVRAQPNEASFRSRLGVTYAYLGRKTDAVREAEAAVRLLPVSKEAYRGTNLVAALALVYATVGRRADAVDRLEYLLSIPSQVARPLLRMDPRWSPLRGYPRFEQLVGPGG
jgi:tetratricopeptide (TPR) repeat protein